MNPTLSTLALIAQDTGDTGGSGVPVLAVASIGGFILFVVAILGTVQGIKMIAGAKKDDPKKNLEATGNVFLGVLVISVCWGGAIVAAVVGFLSFFTDLEIGAGLGG